LAEGFWRSLLMREAAGNVAAAGSGFGSARVDVEVVITGMGAETASPQRLDLPGLLLVRFRFNLPSLGRPDDRAPRKNHLETSMRTQNTPSRWLIASSVFLAFCSQGPSPSPTSPSKPGAQTTAGDAGLVGASADGDVKVGTGSLEIVRLRMDRQSSPGVSVLRQYVNPGQTYEIKPGETIELWAEYPPEVANPRFRVEWGDGAIDATGCGSCLLTHRYLKPGRYVVKASLDDRISTLVTRTFTLNTPENSVAACAPGSVSSIPFAPRSTAGTAVGLSDDQVSGAIPIGFNFTFFGNAYNTLYISSNGFVSFDPGVDDGCCEGESLPTNDSVNNVIAANWTDLYPPGGGTITYSTSGSAGSRVMTISYSNIDHCCTTGTPTVTTQILLFETSNNIEIHTTSIVGGAGGENQTMGIENATGTVGRTVPGRNKAFFSASNEAWLFCGPS
jgi:hypothetical protein